jgi:hypothetical protein
VSVFTKTAPIGVDIPVQRFQQALYPLLLKLWGLPDAGALDAQASTRWDSYGRAFRNQTIDGYVPEAFIGDTNQNIEYGELYFNDTLAVTSFFGLGEIAPFKSGTAIAPVFWIFTVDLTKVKPGITWRADEEVRNDLQRLCQVPRYGFVLNQTITGIDGVFKEYAGFRKAVGIKYRDQQPFHCFRLNFSVAYNINDCYLSPKTSI